MNQNGKHKQHKCCNCGAPIFRSIPGVYLYCNYCGGQFNFEENTTEKMTTDDLNLLLENQKANRLSKLLNDIKFLESQFEMTHHPSIPIKIKKTKELINKINN